MVFPCDLSDDEDCVLKLSLRPVEELTEYRVVLPGQGPTEVLDREELPDCGVRVEVPCVLFLEDLCRGRVE